MYSIWSNQKEEVYESRNYILLSFFTPFNNFFNNFLHSSRGGGNLRRGEANPDIIERLEKIEKKIERIELIQ